MATSFTNNWKNILDKLQSLLRAEFGNTLPVYIGENEKAGSQYLRLEPKGSDLVDYMTNSETREFSINMFLYFGDKSDSRTALDAILRLVSRVESLIHDNIIITLSDSTTLYNCRIESTDLNQEDSEFNTVLFNLKAEHTITF